MKNTKNTFFGSIGIVLLSVLCLLFLSKHSVVLSFMLVLIAYIKHRIYPIQKELAWFMLLSVSGALVEILLVEGAHAWRYETQHIFGIPVWMPIFWGVVGTTIISVYEGFLRMK